MNMNRLHDVTCCIALILQHQRCPHEHAVKVRMYFTTLSECGNQCIYFNYCKLFMLPVGIGVEFDEIVITVCFD